MVVALPRVLFFALLVGAGLAKRVTHKLSEQGASGEFEQQRGNTPTWYLSYRGVPCHLKEELGQLGTFVSGLATWGKDTPTQKILKDARVQASKHNCRLCDIRVEGSILPVTIASSKPWAEVTVSCAADASNLQTACFTSHGSLGGAFAQASPWGICAPCPKECDAGCEKPGNTDWGSTWNWFKCKTREPKVVAMNPETAYGEGKYVKLPSGFSCEKTALKNIDPEALSGETGLSDKSPVPKFTKRADFKKSGEWKLWCLYKEDYASGLADEEMSPAIAEGSQWTFYQGITGCSHEAEGEGSESEVESPQDLLPLLEKAASPELLRLARSNNCNVCEVTYGGFMKSMLNLEVMAQAVSQVSVLGDEEEDSSKPLWVKPVCAVEAMGLGACNRALGPVGWASPKSCLPCPPECMECEPIKKTRTFKCVLLPSLTYPSPTLQAIAGKEQADPDKSMYILPKTVECETPKPRRCTWNSKSWCRTWQFKTTCKFPDSFV